MRRLLSYVVIVISCYSYSQSDYRFRNFTINEGLSQSLVLCIVQDDLHSLWIGTQDGLNRYDGTTFEVFNSDNTKGIQSEYIKCAEKDHLGNLWFGTNTSLLKYEQKTETFRTYLNEGGQQLPIEDIEIEGGRIWVGSSDFGLFQFDTLSKKYTPFAKKVPGKIITDIFLNDEGLLFVASEDAGLQVYDAVKDKSRKITLPKGIRVNKILSEGSEQLLLATSAGVLSLNVKTGSIKEKFPFLNDTKGTLNVSDLYYSSKTGWLIATNNDGLYTITDKGEITHSVADYFQKSALLFDELNVIYKDNAGIFWIGSQRGLSSFDPTYEGFFGIGVSGNPERGLPTASVWSFDEDDNGKYLFVGTDRAVSRLNKSTGVFDQYPRGKQFGVEAKGEQAVLSLKVVNAERILVGCADGFYDLRIQGSNYEYRKISLSEEAGGSKHNRVYKIVEWKTGQYLLATKNGAVIYDVNKGVTNTFEHDPSNPETTITRGVCRLACKDINNNFWLATSSGGLNRLSEDENGKPTISPYYANDNIKALTKTAITSIHIDNQGVMWMGTAGGGLLMWNEGTKEARKFGKEEGIPNNVIYSVLEDRKGNLWLSSNKGLFSFNKTTKKIKVYTEVDGLQGNEFNLGAFMKSKSGTFYFGGIYGMNYFRPEEINKDSREIGVVFSRFKLDNEWLKPGAKNSPLAEPLFQTEIINLSYKQRSFTIKFQPAVLNQTELINYKYILEGSDEGEILLGTSNEIHFNSLSSGSYTLKVFARKGSGPWSKQPATIKIVIASPFWFTWWFGLITIAVLYVVVRVVIKRRVDSARRDQVRLEMKIRERTKEIEQQKKKIEQQKQKIEEEKNKVERQQVLLQREKDKSEKLLKNIIPESTAEELKKKGKARARAYKTVSVLFTDFVGFTKISDRMTATELVRKLDVYFTKFDEIIVNNNLEKIKTIGDAYMCAGGVPVRNNTNPIDTCLAALQIQDYMDKRKNEAIANGEEYWELRLGINTGEVTAGVIGSERLAYDIWGATVNQAQRMEMLGEPGKVTVTGATYSHIEPYFECTFKGKAQSKSRGLIDMYVVERIKPELSVNGEGIIPNKRFHQIVNLHHYSSINYYKAERHIMQLLEKHLSKDLYYHSIEHTKDVVKAVERIALLENVTDEGLFLLKSAATYHDAGFVEQYDKNEPVGARLAEEILPKYGYSEKHIERIKELIYVTMIPHQPKNLLEEIICDADLDYLGRNDFHEISDRLKRELIEHGKIENDREWDEIQVKFLTSHKFFTETAKNTRDKKKSQNLQEVIDRLEKNEYK